jgi:hypothetical protein
LSFKLYDLCFIPSQADTSLFLYLKSDIIIYVDDIIVTNSSDQAIAILLNDLNVHFTIKNLCDLHFFLGIKVKNFLMDLFSLKKNMHLIYWLMLL